MRFLERIEADIVAMKWAANDYAATAGDAGDLQTRDMASQVAESLLAAQKALDNGDLGTAGAEVVEAIELRWPTWYTKEIGSYWQNDEESREALEDIAARIDRADAFLRTLPQDFDCLLESVAEVAGSMLENDLETPGWENDLDLVVEVGFLREFESWMEKVKSRLFPTKS